MWATGVRLLEGLVLSGRGVAIAIQYVRVGESTSTCFTAEQAPVCLAHSSSHPVTCTAGPLYVVTCAPDPPCVADVCATCLTIGEQLEMPPFITWRQMGPTPGLRLASWWYLVEIKARQPHRIRREPHQLTPPALCLPAH